MVSARRNHGPCVGEEDTAGVASGDSGRIFKARFAGREHEDVKFAWSGQGHLKSINLKYLKVQRVSRQPRTHVILTHLANEVQRAAKWNRC